jgi:hypothetical protein
VRWVAVRHAADHIHLGATLARQYGIRPKIWNDFYRVREACRDAEEQFGLRATAPADRTAARQPTRAETEQTACCGWKEAPRVWLRREVATAAAGAGTEQEFFARLAGSGVAVRKRYSTINPSEVTGYAVGLPEHVSKDGGLIWYSGGKLAADLSLPQAAPPVVDARRRWSRVPWAGHLGRGAARCPAEPGNRRRGPGAGRSRILRSAANDRHTSPAPLQRSQPGSGHRLFSQPGRSVRQRGISHLVRRRTAS